jgi:hypothetical protein
VAPHGCGRGMARHVIAQAKARHKSYGAIVSLLIGDAPSWLRRLHLMAPQGMIAFCDTQERMPIVRVQGLPVGGQWR